ncbi:CHAD domain-containing protein [bacterium]|nr:MAG: CHAD domain-containing protein [bacterium]
MCAGTRLGGGVKARRVAAATSIEAMRRKIVRLRLAEVLSGALALDRGEAAPLHDLRIACKRLRYALELHRVELPAETQAAERILAELQDMLGEIHDCDVLLAMAAKGGDGVARMIDRDRRGLLMRVRRLWRTAFAVDGALDVLAAYAGFGSPQGSPGAAP